MNARVHIATEKATGKTWTYECRRIYGRVEFRAVPFKGSFAPTLTAARHAAQVANSFRYDGEPPIIRIVD